MPGGPDGGEVSGSARDAGDSDAAKPALRELLLGGLNGDAEWVEPACSVIRDPPLAGRFTERDLGAVKPHVVWAGVGPSHPKRQPDLGLVQPHGDLPGAGAAAVGGDEPNDPSVVGHPRREPAHLLGAARGLGTATPRTCPP